MGVQVRLTLGAHSREVKGSSLCACLHISSTPPIICFHKKLSSLLHSHTTVATTAGNQTWPSFSRTHSTGQRWSKTRTTTHIFGCSHRKRQAQLRTYTPGVSIFKGRGWLGACPPICRARTALPTLILYALQCTYTYTRHTAHCTLHIAHCTAAHLRNSHLSNRIGQSARARPSRTTAALNATLPHHQRRPKPPPLATTIGSRLVTTTGCTCLPCAGSTGAPSNSRPACRLVWSTLTGVVRHRQSWFAICLARVCSRRRWCTTQATPALTFER